MSKKVSIFIIGIIFLLLFLVTFSGCKDDDEYQTRIVDRIENMKPGDEFYPQAFVLNNSSFRVKPTLHQLTITSKTWQVDRYFITVDVKTNKITSIWTY